MTESAVHQEPDLVPGRRLLWLALLALLVSGVGVLGSWLLWRASPAAHDPSRTPSRAAFRAGTPEQTPIDGSARGLALQAEQRQQLTRYGWADRDAGLARIPIERAIDLRVEGEH